MTTDQTPAAAGIAATAIASGPADATASLGRIRNIVLVHGAFADGSGWKAVARLLQHEGYVVSIVQQPMTSLKDDIAATERVLNRQAGPSILVGHSYGGGVITMAGHSPMVAGLVYVAAFAPDEGEALGPLTGSMPPATVAIAPTDDGYLFVDPVSFPADFAADLSAEDARFMALSQMPTAAEAFGTIMGVPAWKTKPSWGIVATQDRMINPDLERWMYERADAHITEVDASHAVYVSQPRAVADVIIRAAFEAR